MSARSPGGDVVPRSSLGVKNLPRTRAAWALLILLAPVRWAGASAPSADVTAAAALVDAGDIPGAKARLEPLAARSPPDPWALQWLGHLALDEGKRAMASDTARARTQLALAEDLLGRAVDADPETAAHHAWLAAALDKQIELNGRGPTQLVRARRLRGELLRTLELEPTHFESRMGLIRYYHEAPFVAGGSKAKSEQQMLELARLHPARAHVRLAQVLVGYGEHERALEEAKRHVAANPADPLGLFGIGYVGAISGLELELAERSLRQYLQATPSKSHPSLAAARGILGLVLEKRGDVESARAEYRAALEDDPTVKEAVAGIARLESRRAAAEAQR